MADADCILQTKFCPKCAETKPVSGFGVQLQRSDGLRGWCKTCHNKSNANWRAKNPETSKLLSHNWQKANPEKVAAKMQRYKDRNRNRLKEHQAKYRLKNRDRIAVTRRAWQKARRSIPQHIIKKRVSERVRMSLFGKKGGRIFVSLGYSPEHLMAHLERQFTQGMTWDLFLRGDIHIDHIVPHSIFKYESVNCPDFKAAWALSNLRPLWAAENCSKRNKRLFLI